jgi:urease accessory protein
MSNALAMILADTRFPSSQPPHSGGVETACAKGLIKDLATLRSFLRGRLGATGTLAAYTAASVCAQASRPKIHPSLWRSVEAEVDARIFSPAARAASREQGGQVLRLALTISEERVLDSLARATVAVAQRPHHAVALGAVGAAASSSPADAATAAAFASVAGPAFAAQQILGLDPAAVAEIGVEMLPEIDRLATEAAAHSLQPPSSLPCFSAPALDYLAEEHSARAGSSFGS